jgi:hypothetical protein
LLQAGVCGTCITGVLEGVLTHYGVFLADSPKPEWKAVSDAKKNVRHEKAPVVADAISAR